MDTKERKRRPAAREKTQPRRRRAEDPKRRRRKRLAEDQKRVVRAPREDIPEVVYTMPKPFRKGRFLLKILSVVAVVAALMMALSIFFRVETIAVSGTERYSPWMIRQASGINEGDSLLGISDGRVAGKIQSELPYVDDVKVGINLPGTVYIEVRELQVTYAIQASDATWWLIDSDGDVIEPIAGSAASGYTRILGVMADGPRAGQKVVAMEAAVPTEPSETEETEGSLAIPTQPPVTGAQRLSVALEILNALEENEVIGQIASVDVSDVLALTMEYGQRFHVVLGDSERLGYKISYMAQAISQLQDHEIGELDVSFEFSEDALLSQPD